MNCLIARMGMATSSGRESVEEESDSWMISKDGVRFLLLIGLAYIMPLVYDLMDQWAYVYMLAFLGLGILWLTIPRIYLDVREAIRRNWEIVKEDHDL